MADLKLSDLLAATNLSEDTFFYGIQGGVSKKIASNVILRNLTDPIIKGRLVLDGVQLLRGTDANQTIAMDKSRTEFSVGSLVVYPTLPNANVDGMVKVITLANVQGGRVELTTSNSNILPNVSVTFQKAGESILLVYSANSYSNGWTILGTTPSLVTSLELPEANVSDARIRRAISAGDVTISYDQANGKIRVGDLSNVVAKVSLANVTTDDLREGNVNLYFTNARAVAALQPDLNQLRKKNANIMYVSTNGDDSLDGLTMPNAIANIHIALARIAGNVAYGDGKNVNWTVKVFPGRYTLYNNPVTIPRETSLIGHDLRSTDIYPENETADMFYLNNGIYVNGFTFRGHRAANPANVRAGAAVFSYNPNKSAGNITTSPYIQNCSSITTNGTGMRIDGNYVGGLKSAVLDAFTQFNVGGIGIHLVNGGYMQLVSLFTICCAYSVLAESGGFCSVTNSNSSFGEYGLVADGVGPTNYSGNVTRQVSSRSVEIEFNTRGNTSIRSTPPNIQDKAIMANYNQAKCFRDTGLIVDSFAFDLAYNSNVQSRFSGLQYATQGISLVEDQKVELDRTFRYFKSLCTNVIVNSTSWDFDANTPYQGANNQVIIAGAPSNSEIANVAIDSIDQFLDIYNNGVFGVTDAIIPHKYPANVIASRQNAANLLVANKNFIRSEVAAYFANVYPYATYIPSRSLFDDIGYMVDSLAFDISHEGNRQMIMRAILMWDYLTEGDISTITNQIPQTSAAFAYIKTIIDEILTLQNVSPRYQTTYSQNTSFASGVSTNEISYVRNRIDDITSIIEGGATYQNVKDNITALPLTANTDPNVVLATQIILSNRDFIRAEVLEYVNQNWMNISNGTRNFYTVGEVTNVSSNTCIVTFDEKILFVDRPVANTIVSFHNGSYISTSGHTFEYVGAGANLANALPFNGGIPVQENEVVETRGGAVYYTSTDHKGDFRIGNELLINRATGTINGRTFNKSLFAVMTPYILALQ